MSGEPVPVLLNRGLDLVTPPLMAEPGALIDCLNYEMTSNVGYRRIDGYERYDGWVDGGISGYLAVELTAETPIDQSQLTARSLIGEVNPLTGQAIYFAAVLGVEGTRAYYVPFKNTRAVRFGERLYVTTPSGTSYYFTATSESVSGKTLSVDAKDYTSRLREYSATMRSFVNEMPGRVAGIHYGTDRMYAAIDTAYIRATTVTPAAIGSTVTWQGDSYMVVNVIPTDDIDTYMYSLEPLVQGIATPNTNLVVLNADGSVARVAGVGEATDDPSPDAYMIHLHNPDTSEMRGYTKISRSVTAEFTAGSSTSQFGPDLDTPVYAISGGNILQVKLVEFSQSAEGGWTTADAGGRLSLVVVDIIAGTRNYLTNDDVLYYDAGSVQKLASLNTVATSRLAGTGALMASNTRYQWGTYNFYAADGMEQVYGVNGVTRGFWVKPDSWGSIVTNPVIASDNPKYISMHARVALMLGFARGSVMSSVPGSPLNFQGVLGAVEFSIGDRVTGLLESADTTTLVFGKRSISRIIGTSVDDYGQRTVVPNAGALDYTAVNVGSMPVFTDPYGVSTLEQSSSYGDFVGERATHPISDWLVPKLVPGVNTIESGGVVCAIPVREKMQYRLFLTSGEVISVCFSSEGPKSMISNYAIMADEDNVRIPLAWTSQVNDDGKEVVAVVWNYGASFGSTGAATLPSNPKLIHRLEYGWGYDGRHLKHHFDMAHTFMNSGSVNTTIGQVRMYGKSYGVATMNLRSSSVEDDFDMPFNTTEQDMSLPANQEHFYDNMKDVTNINDHANWGLGTKFRMDSTNEEGSTLTEPPHVCQLMVMYMSPTGALDG